jgi:hypothetical protein
VRTEAPREVSGRGYRMAAELSELDPVPGGVVNNEVLAAVGLSQDRGRDGDAVSAEEASQPFRVGCYEAEAFQTIHHAGMRRGNKFDILLMVCVEADAGVRA